MTKGTPSKGERLMKGCAAHNAISSKVDMLWDEYEGDFSRYPAPRDVAYEFEELLLRHGDDWKSKARNVYNNCVDKKFGDHG